MEEFSTEKGLFEDTVSMKRLKIKGKLIKDVSMLFKSLSQYKEVLKSYYGKKFRRKAERSVYKDFVKGLKGVNSKVPVFIELPKLKEYGNGGYTEEKDSKKEAPVVDKDKPPEVVYENVDLLEGNSMPILPENSTDEEK